MGKTRHIDTITDYLIVAFSPALVMFMVASLVFFAINCFYVGSFDGRLYFATGLFVFAAVLISRISINEGREYASMFAIPLSITTVLSIMRYTDVNLLFILPLVAFIWWSTDKLTWDCTVIDTKKDASGEGLLQTIGLDEGEAADDSQVEHVQEHLDAEATTDKTEADSKTLWEWWLNRRRRNHTPGVWVIYFGLAAIPIFGFGQFLLPEHQYGPSFFLLCIYVASALSLLMATSFLQMRRYLNQRRLPFTDAMAGVWLSNGGIIIVGLMLVCLLLPRPNTGYSLIDQVSKIGSSDQKSSRVSPIKKNGVQDEDRDGDGESDEEAKSDSEKGTQRSDSAKQGSKSSENAKTKGDKQSKSGKRDTGESDESNSDGEESNDDSQQSDDSRGNNESDRENGGEESNNNEGSESEPENDSSKDQDSEGENGSSNSSSSSTPENSFKPPELPDLLPEFTMPSIPKLVYFVLIAALVLFAFLRYGRQIGAAINAFLRDLADFFRRLFGGKPRSRAEDIEVLEEAEAAPAPRPFSSFPDPFTMGTSEQYTPQQLVNYSFEALQAWAYERDCSRSEEQTPLEFATQIAGSHRQVGPAAKNLAILYNQVAYAPGTIGADSLEHVKRLWTALRTRPSR